MKREVQRLVEKWTKILDLQNWTFQIELSKKNIDPDESGLEIPAQTVISSRYSTCLIKINPCYSDYTKNQREFFIIHELCHCITDKLDELLYRIECGKHVAYGQRIDVREEVTDKMARILYREVINPNFIHFPIRKGGEK